MILQRVGVIGLGIMGMAYATNLRRAGAEVVGFDPVPSARAALDILGGRGCATAAEVAKGADVILMALPSVKALNAVVAEILPHLHAGMVIAEMGTLPLEAKEAVRVACSEVGVALLDCPVSGTGAQAATGDLVVFASGEAADVEVLRPVFAAMARDIRHVGPFGAGMKLKLVANLLVTIHNLAAAEALLLAQKSGLDLGMVYEAIRSGAGNSRMFEVRAPLMIEGRYEPATMKMDVYQKDLALIMDYAREVACPVPLMAASLPFYSAALAQGRHKEDTGALFAVLQKMAPGPEGAV
ncbi:MAG: NAD(P)-dependent oxidoreductase [Alphaproteobacteria bacterium]|jgi:3-hydroxyisobutyrate dehydrogenase-like beta-hydroxyacid dehydrogenase|nr:NAD(P)-dependent oxidoreductase [Alphaproteobacteria bacterium]